MLCWVQLVINLVWSVYLGSSFPELILLIWLGQLWLSTLPFHVTACHTFVAINDLLAKV